MRALRDPRPSDDTEPIGAVRAITVGFRFPNDEELVHRLTQGDAWAKEALYRKHFAAVFRTALRLLENRADAEDVVQDSFVTAFNDIAALRDISSFGGWLIRITVRQAHRRFRQRRLRQTLGLKCSTLDATLTDLASTEDDLETREALAIIERELRELSLNQRSAWLLRRVEGHKIEEVASACTCSIATAKRWIRAADDRLAQFVCLEGQDEL